MTQCEKDAQSIIGDRDIHEYLLNEPDPCNPRPQYKNSCLMKRPFKYYKNVQEDEKNKNKCVGDFYDWWKINNTHWTKLSWEKGDPNQIKCIKTSWSYCLKGTT